MRILILILVSGCLVTGCARMKSWIPHRSKKTENKSSPDSTTPSVTVASSDAGKIARVDTNARYVVMTFPFGGVPAVGQRLNVYRKSLKVGEVKVTGPQQDNNTVGDIISGEPQLHDEVRAD